MKYAEINKIRKFYFGCDEIARALGVSPASAKVSAARYAGQGLIIRLKRNMYVLAEKWRALSKEESFLLANAVQVPSYISLTTALEYYGVTTQAQRDFVESVALKRTKLVEVGGVVFNYSRIARSIYSGFYRKNGIFIALPEKALLDALYLMSIKRYTLDISALDVTKLDKGVMRRFLKSYPAKTRIMAEALWKS